MFDSQSGEDKVRKFVLFLTLTTGMSGTAMAEGWEFFQSGTAGLYYGITEDRDRHNIRNSPNRTVFRADGRFEALYEQPSGIRTGAAANYTVVIRQHDASYPQGDWRFYPYLLAEKDDYGKLTIGYTYNAAYLLHQGAQEISWIGIKDSNLTYWLSGVNWSNRLKKVRFATPKSTYIMDDGRAFKFSYFTPLIGNTKFGFSYAPDNANRRGMVSRYARYEKKEDGLPPPYRAAGNSEAATCIRRWLTVSSTEPTTSGLSARAGSSANLTFPAHIRTLMYGVTKTRFRLRRSILICRLILTITAKGRPGTSASGMILAGLRQIWLICMRKPIIPAIVTTCLCRPTVMR